MIRCCMAACSRSHTNCTQAREYDTDGWCVHARLDAGRTRQLGAQERQKYSPQLCGAGRERTRLCPSDFAFVKEAESLLGLGLGAEGIKEALGVMWRWGAGCRCVRDGGTLCLTVTNRTHATRVNPAPQTDWDDQHTRTHTTWRKQDGGWICSSSL